MQDSDIKCGDLRVLAKLIGRISDCQRPFWPAGGHRSLCSFDHGCKHGRIKVTHVRIVSVLM
jgi:hypothetical protein